MACVVELFGINLGVYTQLYPLRKFRADFTLISLHRFYAELRYKICAFFYKKRAFLSLYWG
jgi:hypothetical protein